MKLIRALLCIAVGGCSRGASEPRRAEQPDDPAALRECGTVQEVLSVEGFGIHRRTALLIQPADPNRERFVLEDDVMVRAIEAQHQIVFDDALQSRLPQPSVTVCVEGSMGRVERDGRVIPTLLDPVRFQPAGDPDGKWTQRAELAPACPQPDQWHRYVTVPLDYDSPEDGTFDLYYEVDSDYDPTRPTVMIPADAQQTQSWVGRADNLKARLGLEAFNVVTHQHRGSYCSRFAPETLPTDWRQAYRWFRLESTVEDLDRVRRDLLGDEGKMMMWGCSGVATTAAAYLRRYHRHVSRAALGSFYLDPTLASNGAVEVFETFLGEYDLEAQWDQVVADPTIDPLAALHVTQRLLYDDRETAAALVRELARGDRGRWEKLTAQPGFDVQHFVRSIQLDWPQAVVFMFESNVPADGDADRDINRPMLAIGEPLASIARDDPTIHRWSREGLDRISTPVLLFAGTLDHATPTTETEQIHAAMPNSTYALFDANHCLVDTDCVYGQGFVAQFLAGDEVTPPIAACGGRVVEP